MRDRQVHQALPVHLDRGEKKEPADEGDRKGELETKEIKVLWDHLERVASKASWHLWDHRVKLDPKDKKEMRGLQVCRELKGSLANRFLPLLLLFLLQNWTASFQCSVSGNPQPKITWSKQDGQSNITRSAGSRGTLLLQRVVGSDSGVYKCSASSILGQAEALVQLIVNGKLFKLH